MTSRDLVRAITKWSGKTYMECADALGLNRQQWYRRLSNGTFTVDELLRLVDACGLEIGFAKDKEVWIAKESHGTLRANSQGKRYSTAASRPLAYDGELELYIDPDDEYFLADYGKKKVYAVEPSVAEAFAEHYS